MEIFTLGSVCFVKFVIPRADQIDVLFFGNFVCKSRDWVTKSV